MKRKTVQYWLFMGIVTLSILALGIVFLVSLGQDNRGNTLGVTLEPGSTLGSVALVNVESSFQYSLDNGQTWINIAPQTTRVDNLVVAVGDTILVRDTARAGFSQQLTVRDADLAN